MKRDAKANSAAVEKGDITGKNPEPNQTQSAKQSSTETEKSVDPLDATSKQLFESLKERRSVLAKEENKRHYLIATNATLEDLARRCPLKYNELLDVKGISEKQQEKYGTEWLEVIAQFTAARKALVHKTTTLAKKPPVTPRPTSKRRLSLLSESSNSSPAFESPESRKKPQMHTGLSFSFADVELNDETTMTGLYNTPTKGILKNGQSYLQNTSSERRTKVQKTQSSGKYFEVQNTPT